MTDEEFELSVIVVFEEICGGLVMGEAKRRKMRDPGYGKPRLQIGCFLSKSTLSDAHAVYVGIGRESDVSKYIVSEHKYIIDAYRVLQWCKRVLDESLAFKLCQSDLEILESFQVNLLEIYGDYPSDDNGSMISGNGVEEKVKPITKIYNVVSVVSIDKHSLFGDPEDNCGFFIKDADGEYFFKENVFVFSSYITAAYIADFLNESGEGSITKSKFSQLFAEAQKLQGKL